MKVLLFGANGWIGNMLVNLLNGKKINTVVATCRMDDTDSVRKLIETENPSHIISSIGRTHGTINGKVYPTIDYLEQKDKLVENVRDNLYAPISLSILAKEYRVHFTYIGTGCIFEYDDEHVIPNPNPNPNKPNGQKILPVGFTESANPNFFGSSYSVVKGFTDRLEHLLESNTLNARIRMPITADNSSRNFITKITNYEKICSIENSMTVLPELLPILLDMAENKVTGTVNLTNPGTISHNTILQMYKEIVNPDFTWKNFSIEEQSQILAAGRSNNFLDTSKLKNMYPNVKNIEDSVRDILIEMKKRNINKDKI